MKIRRAEWCKWKGAISESGNQNNAMSEQKGDLTKKHKVILQTNDMEVDIQVTQTLNHNIHENCQITEK
eukprot:9679191-Ditylum_brightwellii.AAC.1